MQSDLDIFQFDFMSVKPHDVAPLLRAKVQTEMRLWSRTAPVPEGRRSHHESHESVSRIKVKNFPQNSFDFNEVSEDYIFSNY